MPRRVQPARRGHKENGCLCQVQHRGTGLTHLYKSFVILVPGGGVEPPRGCPRRILSPLRLPVPPSRQLIKLRQNTSTAGQLDCVFLFLVSHSISLSRLLGFIEWPKPGRPANAACIT